MFESITIRHESVESFYNFGLMIENETIFDISDSNYTELEQVMGKQDINDAYDNEYERLNGENVNKPKRKSIKGIISEIKARISEYNKSHKNIIYADVYCLDE